MPWQFVGRTEEIARVRAAIANPGSGPVVITGEPGMGRTSVLRTALLSCDDADLVLRVEPEPGPPFTGLRPWLPPEFSSRAALGQSITAAARSIAARAGRRSRGLVIVADDAHLVDHASLLVLRELSRQSIARLLLTRPSLVGRTENSDPTDCLGYEPTIQTIPLRPLDLTEVTSVLHGVVLGDVDAATAAAVHATTGGNPRLLHDLVVGGRLTMGMNCTNGVWRLGDHVRNRTATTRAIVARVVEAVRQAWRELALDRAEQLCRLAAWEGAADQVAAVAAGTLLLLGRTEEAMRRLDALPAKVIHRSSVLVLTKAMCLASGRSVDDAETFLLDVARSPESATRALAYRAWLLAVDGQRPKDTGRAPQGDRESKLFWHAAAAITALSAGQAIDAVGWLRRSIAMAEGCQETVPWMTPWLTARLVTALSLAGRTNEAAVTARTSDAGRRSELTISGMLAERCSA